MKTKLYSGAILSILLVGGSVFAATKPVKPKVTQEQAQAIALARIPGTVENATTVKNDYSIEILGKDGIKTDVLVSEKNGKIKRMVVE